MAKRTQAEIDRQINGLLAMKEWLPKRSMFGDDNWGRIDVQVLILKGERQAETYEFSDDESLYNDALSAEAWLDGVSNDDLFETQ